MSLTTQIEDAFQPLTAYFKERLSTSLISARKLNLFALLCSLLLTFILSNPSYFAGLLAVLGLFFLLPFILAIHTLESPEQSPFGSFFTPLLLCDLLLTLGLILHNSETPFILPLAMLTLLGFLLPIYLAKKKKWVINTLNFTLHTTFLMLCLSLHISIILLFFYSIFLNGQIILKWAQSDHS